MSRSYFPVPIDQVRESGVFNGYLSLIAAEMGNYWLVIQKSWLGGPISETQPKENVEIGERPTKKQTNKQTKLPSFGVWCDESLPMSLGCGK